MSNRCCKCGKEVYGVAQDIDKLFKELCKGCMARLKTPKKTIETVENIIENEEENTKKKLTKCMKKDTVGDKIELNPDYEAK